MKKLIQKFDLTLSKFSEKFIKGVARLIDYGEKSYAHAVLVILPTFCALPVLGILGLAGCFINSIAKIFDIGGDNDGNRT